MTSGFVTPAWHFRRQFAPCRVFKEDSRPFSKTGYFHYRDQGHRCPRKRCRPRMTQWAAEDIPDFVKKLNELELQRRAQLSRDPPIPLSDECIEGLRAAIPDISKLDEALKPDVGPLIYDPSNPATYSWMYMNARRKSPNAYLMVLVSVGVYGIFRNIVPVLRSVISKYTRATLASAALRIDLWSTISVGCGVPAIILLLLSGKDNGKDAMRRGLCMYFCCAALLIPAVILASTGAVRAALVSSTFIRTVSMPATLWFWQDLLLDVESSDAWIKPIFQAWRTLTTLLICGFGGILRAFVFTRANYDEMLSLFCQKTGPLRLYLGKRFPVALSMLLDVGALQFSVTLLYSLCCLYGLYVVFIATDFLQVREHRFANLPLSNMFSAIGLYEDSSIPSSRRFVSAAPPGVESYCPSSAMFLRKVEGLLASDSSLLVKEERPAFLDLLDNEKLVMKEKKIKEWMPPRTQFVVPDDRLSERQIRFDSLHTWARPLTEEQKEMPFAQFFETLEEDEYFYDPESDQWTFSMDMLSGDTARQDVLATGDSDPDVVKGGQVLTNGGDEPDDAQTVFV